MQLPMQVPADFTIIAHRGASAYAPENTAAAFELAHEMGIADVELDTRLTIDGEIALSHDDNLSRYGHGELAVEQMTWAELAALDMGAWFSPYLYGGTRMWRLDDLFHAFGGRFTYHVELKGKSDRLAEAVLTCINRYDIRDNCIITSFQYEQLVAMRELDKDIRMGWLVRNIDDDALIGARELAMMQLCPQAAFVDAEQVELARMVVPEVRAWGINGDASEIVCLVQRVLDAGCDGMTINWPDWVSPSP